MWILQFGSINTVFPRPKKVLSRSMSNSKSESFLHILGPYIMCMFTYVCVRVCVRACTYASDVYSRAGVVHMDSHLLNTSDDFFLMSSQVHSYSPQIPEEQHTNNRHLFTQQSVNK